MKTIKYIVSLAAVCMLAMSVSARTFEQGEKIYVNADQSFHDGNGNYNWTKDNAKLYLYIFKKVGNQESNKTWVTLSQEKGDIYGGEVPAGEYNVCIVVRGTAPNWDGKWNQTGDMGFPNEDRNYIYKFWDGGVEAEWQTYVPEASKIASYASALRSAGKEEEVHICSQALGGPYSLRVKLKDGGKEYDYENVQCHGWYKSTDGNTWTSVDDYAGAPRDGEGDKDILKNTLPSSGTVYYYLHSSKAAGRRLIKLIPDAEGCELDCKITFFGVASSEVNANDTTYTLDGMVAFGVPCGDLEIECDGKKAVIKAADVKSPQIFSIEGLRAATTNGKKTTATAKFTGNESGKVTAEVEIPNVTQGIIYKHIDVLVGETAPLEPTGANYSNKHIWYIDGEQTDRQGKQTSIAFDEQNTTRYAYREFNPPSGTMDDMMSNGNYEDENSAVYGEMGKKSTISDYDFWDKYENKTTAINFYENESINPKTGNPEHPITYESNGFAVVQSANNFFYTFANVQPQEGDYFALFDAASDGVPNKKAWFANTAKNENLKLRKGTTYLFSFWAANINNYGEMDNAAKLQFQIEYNGKTEKLGDVLNLGSAEFRNNRWHQCSATFTADADADNVTISVINLNINELITGNDFALDDIQFRAVSSPTRSVKMQQVFTVETHEPKIESVSAQNVPMPCGENKYDIKVTVKYKNPKGQLVIKDIKTGKEYPQDVPAVGNDWEVLKTPTFTIHIDHLTADQQHQFTASFPDYPKAQFTDDTVLDEPKYKTCADFSLSAEVIEKGCDSTAYDVKLTVEYVNPDGKLIIKDTTSGKEIFNDAVPFTLNETLRMDTTIRINKLEDHTFIAYFSGKPNVRDTVSAIAPEFVKCADLLLSAEVIDKGCDSTAYDVKLTVKYVNPDGNLVIKDVTDDAVVFDEAVPFTLNDTLQKDTTIRIAELKDHEFIAYYAGKDTTDTVPVLAPAFVKCPEVIKLDAEVFDKGCDSTAYDVKLTVTYVNPDGNLVIKDVTDDTVVFDESVPFTLNDTLQMDTTIRIAELKDHEFIAYYAGKDTTDPVPVLAPAFVRCPEVIKLDAEVFDKGCDSIAYDVKLTVTYVNPDGNLVIKDVTDNTVVFDEAVPFTLNDTLQMDTTIRIAELKDHEFIAYFAGKDTSDVVTVLAPAFVKCPEVIKLDAEVFDKGCDSTAYDVKLTVTYVNPDGNLVIKDETDDAVVFDAAVPFTLNETLQKETTIRIAELKNHEFIAYFAGKDTSDIVSVIAPTYVKCPEVITLDTMVIAKGCDSTAYEVKLTVEYVNPDGNLVIKEDGKVVISEVVPAGTLNESQTKVFTIRVADLNDHEFVAAFVGRPAASATANTIAPEFTECCTDGLMFRKWDNVLFINNHDSLYIAYQWYKNGVIMEGDTLQRIYTGIVKMAGTSDIYQCVMKRKDGTSEKSCKYTFDECPSSAEASKLIDEASVSVRPTRVAAGAAVTVSKTTEEAMTATLRTMTGQLISTTQFSESESTMLMPGNAGVYLLQLQGKETNTTVKIHVY